MAPAGTPRPIIDLLQREVRAILTQPDVVKRLLDLGLEASPSTPAQVTETIKVDLARWKQVIRDAKIEIIEK
jgi:tripartite-type tricarboxylate transporter receptor subunit TctC